MTDSSPSKPVCRALTTKGKPCRGRPVADGLCLAHSGIIDVREAGRKGGKARARKRSGSFRQAVADVLGRDPTRHAERLLSSGAAGYKLAAELLEAEEKAETQAAGPIHDASGRLVVGLLDVLHLAYSLPGAATALGLPALDSSQLDKLEAARDRSGGDQGGEPEREGAGSEPESVGVPSLPSTGDPDSE